MAMKFEGKLGLPARLALAAVAVVFVLLAGRDLAASILGKLPNPDAWTLAAKLEPGNAVWPSQLARYASLQDSDPARAAGYMEQAVALNPHDARYWFDLASYYQQMGQMQNQSRAFDAALKADPKTPALAWQAANFYLLDGETDKALAAFRLTLENDPSYREEAMHLIWQASPDVDHILQIAVPPDPELYQLLLAILVSEKQDAPARQVFSRLIQLGKPLNPKKVTFFIRFLLTQGDPAAAMAAWQTMAPLCGLNAYLPNQNLVVNGGFDLRLLNDGFDWHYNKLPHADLALDASDFHGGSRSMEVAFDGFPVGEIGMEQWVPVRPDTQYDFSAFFKTEDMEGAGGPVFLVQDQQSAEIYFTSPFLVGAEIWREVSGTFRTGPNAKLISLRLVRQPADNVIKGKLWVDDVEITVHTGPAPAGAKPQGGVTP